jgi:hypothetical protein
MRFLIAILVIALCTLLLTVAGPNLFGLLIAFAVPIAIAAVVRWAY